MRRIFGVFGRSKGGCEARRKIDMCLVNDNNIIMYNKCININYK
jgi:hypothetical protein